MNTSRIVITMSFIGVIGCMIGCVINENKIDGLKIRIDAAESEISSIKSQLASHREDAKTAVYKIYDDIGKIRFTQAALANSIRFAAGK